MKGEQWEQGNIERKTRAPTIRGTQLERGGGKILDKYILYIIILQQIIIHSGYAHLEAEKEK